MSYRRKDDKDGRETIEDWEESAARAKECVVKRLLSKARRRQNKETLGVRTDAIT